MEAELTKIENFDQTIYLIDQMIAANEDIWQIATDAANYEESETDKRRYNQCDIAARIAKRYGDDAIGKFAVAANIPRRRAQEYRTFGKFWFDRSARAHFLEEHPHTLTYSHLRLAQKIFPDTASAMKWLARAERKNRSVDACEYIWTRAKRIYGPPQPTPPIVETFEAILIPSHRGYVSVMSDAWDRIDKIVQNHPNATIKVVVEYKESA